MIGYPEALSTHGVIRDGRLMVWLQTDGPFPAVDITFVVDVVDGDNEIAWQLRVARSTRGDVSATIGGEVATGAEIEQVDTDELVISVPLASVGHAFPSRARLKVHVHAEYAARGTTKLGQLHHG